MRFDFDVTAMGVAVTLSDALDLFYESYQPSTVVRYRLLIGRWDHYIGDRFLDAVPFDGLRYLREITSQTGIRSRADGNTRYGSATIRQTILVLHGLYKYLAVHGVYHGVNPFVEAARKIPHAEANAKRTTEMIQFDEVHNLLGTVGTVGNANVRDRAMLVCLLYGALRLSEMVALKISDVRADKQGLRLQLAATKSGKPQSQPLSPTAYEALSKLILQRKREGAKSTDSLFASYRKCGKLMHGSWTRNGAYRRFQYLVSQAELSGAISPHSCRATAISKLLEQGLPHKAVQDFSRHGSIEMVARYDKRESEAEESAKALRY